MEPQLVPTDPQRNSDMRRMLLASLLRAVIGELRKALYRAMLIAVNTIVKKRANLGNAWIQ